LQIWEKEKKEVCNFFSVHKSSQFKSNQAWKKKGGRGMGEELPKVLQKHPQLEFVDHFRGLETPLESFARTSLIVITIVIIIIIIILPFNASWTFMDFHGLSLFFVLLSGKFMFHSFPLPDSAPKLETQTLKTQITHPQLQ
jgi:hypothetical protein